MPSLRTAFLAVATAFIASVGADYYIDPDSVSLSTRESWCASEVSTCPIICQQTSSGSEVNTCNATTLTYGCVCDDGKQPNISQYSLTLPYFVCQEWGNQCVTKCDGNNTCESACRQDHPCGAQNPSTNSTNSTATATATTASSTASSTGAVYSGMSGQGSSGAPPSFEKARLYTTAAMLGMFSLGFACLL